MITVLRVLIPTHKALEDGDLKNISSKDSFIIFKNKNFIFYFYMTNIWEYHRLQLENLKEDELKKKEKRSRIL